MTPSSLRRSTASARDGLLAAPAAHSRQTGQRSGAAFVPDHAEVITEAPSDQTVLPLSNFGTVNFTGATVDNTAIGNENPSALTMVSANDVTEATPSALTSGDAFTVT
jgi:Peptidase A4 family